MFFHGIFNQSILGETLKNGRVLYYHFSIFMLPFYPFLNCLDISCRAPSRACPSLRNYRKVSSITARGACPARKNSRKIRSITTMASTMQFIIFFKRHISKNSIFLLYRYNIGILQKVFTLVLKINNESAKYAFENKCFE